MSVYSKECKMQDYHYSCNHSNLLVLLIDESMKKEDYKTALDI
jgi:hypothetical protein